MKTTRHFFISDNLSDLERMEEDLERAGVTTPQVHVLTQNEADADSHRHLNQVVSLMKKDIVHQTLIGAAVGVCVAALTLIIVYALGWAETPAGWIPFIFLAVILLGFCTWEGGLRGIDTPNVHFRSFEKALEDGKHVFFVDLPTGQEGTLKQVARQHSTTIQPAGTARGAPHWLVSCQHKVKRFFVETFP